MSLDESSLAGSPPRRVGSVLMVEEGGRGGEADYTAELTRALTREGWTIDLATADDHLYRPVSGVTVHRVFHYTRGHSRMGRTIRRARLGQVANGVRFLAAVPRLLRVARHADLVHVHGWEFTPLGLLAVGCLRVSGSRIVQTRHNTFERGVSFRRVNAALGQLADATIVHTDADLARLAHERGGHVVVIPHGEYGGLARSGGSADRQDARAALGIPQDASVALFFGHLRRDKGLSDLLEAVARVAGLRLIVAGKDNGALVPARERIEALSLGDRVLLQEGFVEMTVAARLFAAADTVVLPYEIASQSGVLLLAYGFSRPVIVYPVGGLVEAVIDGETGWICARPDIDALAEALAASVAAGWPECRRRGEAGAQFARQRFSWPTIAHATSEVYLGVLTVRSGRSDRDTWRHRSKRRVCRFKLGGP